MDLGRVTGELTIDSKIALDMRCPDHDCLSSKKQSKVTSISIPSQKHICITEDLPNRLYKIILNSTQAFRSQTCAVDDNVELAGSSWQSRGSFFDGRACVTDDLDAEV